MSPIIKFHNEDGPPPFSTRRQPRRTRPNSSPVDEEDEVEEEEASDGHPFPPPSYPPLDSSTPPPNTKPKDRRRAEDDYGDYEAGEDETEGNGLLYEMEDLGGRLDGHHRVQLDTLSQRRARGEASIGGGAPGLFGVTRPTKAAWADIREMMYEVSNQQLGFHRQGVDLSLLLPSSKTDNSYAHAHAARESSCTFRLPERVG